MFSLFKKEEPSRQPPWLAELNETRERWFTFLDKLEAKMEELCTAAIPELRELLAGDEDIYKRTFHKVQAGIRGQLDHIRRKAADTYEEKVTAVFYRFDYGTAALNGTHTLLEAFRNACSDRYHNDFEEKWRHWHRLVDEAAVRDVEAEYGKIIAEFDSIRGKFTCKQCGGPIRIEKIFFISTYIACPHCQTQNTFEPGTQARSLQHIARELAEQRTAHLYAAYTREESMEREMYYRNHELQLSLIHEKDKTKIRRVEAEIAENERRRQQSVADTPKLHQQYLRAMYDEWNRITPDLREHNEKMYQNQLMHIHRSV